MGKGNQKKPKKHSKKAKQDDRRGASSRKSQKKAGSRVRVHRGQQAIKRHLQEMGLVMNDVQADGNCLFRALADQLDGNEDTHAKYRKLCTEFMWTHRTDFEPFMEDDEDFDDYIDRMRSDGEWGGQQEMSAIIRMYDVDIVIYAVGRPKYVMRTNPDASAPHVIHILYEDDCHFLSVRPADQDLRDSMQKLKHKHLKRAELKAADGDRGGAASENGSNGDGDCDGEGAGDCAGEGDGSERPDVEGAESQASKRDATKGQDRPCTSRRERRKSLRSEELAKRMQACTTHQAETETGAAGGGSLLIPPSTMVSGRTIGHDSVSGDVGTESGARAGMPTPRDIETPSNRKLKNRDGRSRARMGVSGETKAEADESTRRGRTSDTTSVRVGYEYVDVGDKESCSPVVISDEQDEDDAHGRERSEARRLKKKEKKALKKERKALERKQKAYEGVGKISETQVKGPVQTNDTIALTNIEEIIV